MCNFDQILFTGIYVCKSAQGMKQIEERITIFIAHTEAATRGVR